MKLKHNDNYFRPCDNLTIIKRVFGELIVLHQQNGNLEKAEEMSRITIETEPENATYLDTYAWILFKAGKLELAKEYIEMAIRFGGDSDPDILEHCGDIMYALERNAEALEFWNKAKAAGGESERLDGKIMKLQ